MGNIRNIDNIGSMLKNRQKKKEKYMLIIIKLPWEKLIIFIVPQINVNPMLTREYIEPKNKPCRTTWITELKATTVTSFLLHSYKIDNYCLIKYYNLMAKD
jgi:hypothetical protein